MFFHRIFTPGLSIYSYLVGDEKTKRCVVIDPTRHVVPYIIHAQNAGFDITDILETHVHADFISGSKELKHQLNEKPQIHASGKGGDKWIPHYADVIVYEGTELKFGDLRLKALHTPGHTPEHLIWICYDDSRSSDIPWFAFTGDSLFVGGIGRPDLLGKREMAILTPQLYHTLFNVFAQLPDFVEIFPSHGEGSLCGKSLKTRGSSTIGYERLFNPFFKYEAQEQWVKKVEEDLLPVPPCFQNIKKVNVEGPPLMNTLKVIQYNHEIPLPDFDQLFLLDIRRPESFALSHLKDSINIPVSPSFAHWAAWMLPQRTSIGLIVENNHSYSEVIDQLRLMGFDQEVWIIPFEEKNFHIPYPLDSLAMMDVDDLGKHQPKFESFFLLDVRTSEEWASGHISGAHHVELNHLIPSIRQLPRDRAIALFCKSGQRASLAASLLKKNGFTAVVNIRGGMQAWKQSGLPIKLGN